MVSFDTLDRLIGKVRSFGCSNSLTDLGRISDLLDEHDGRHPRIIAGYRNKSIRFSWAPHRSLLGFSRAFSGLKPRTNMSIPWSPSRFRDLVAAEIGRVK